jgi:DMSO reductase family type II enzyme chaperone
VERPDREVAHGRREQPGATSGIDPAACGASHPEATTSELALCRSALWEALALGFRPPSPETVERLASPAGVAALGDAAAVLDATAEPGLPDAVRRLARPVSVDGLSARHDELFGHTARGAVPPYETEYGADSLFGPMHEMSDLAAFYRAFGLRLAPTAHERPDHVACECEFLAFLGRKEAYAAERSDESMLEATRQATRRFLRDHLGRWGPGFGRAVARRDGDGFYGSLGTLCAEFVTAECLRVGVPTGPELLRLRLAAGLDVPAACGDAGACVEPADAPGPGSR